MKLVSLYKSHPLPTILSAFVLGILLASTVGFAIAQVANTTYYACVKTSTGTLRIVPANTTCNSNETLISWNQQGPQGIPGPTGAPGPQGPQGPAGSGGDIFSLKPFMCNTCDLSAYPEKFKNQDWSNSQFFTVYINNVDVQGVNFSGSRMSGNQFSGDNLTGSDFSNIKTLDSFNPVSDMTFDGSNLTNANVSNNTFNRVGFRNATLTGTNFSNDSFQHAVFDDANLQNSNFSNVIFGANTSLQGAQNMDTAILTGVNWGGATCPDGTLAQDHPDTDGNPTCIGYLTPIPTPTP